MRVFQGVLALAGHVCVASAAASAQEDPAAGQVADAEQSFAVGVAAMQAGQRGEAIAAFERCHELAPDEPAVPYNLACLNSLEGEIARGLEWLSKAIDLGFGQDAETLATLETDADLDALRADPRFGALRERAVARKATIDAYVAKPGVYVPASLPDDGEAGLLVVLHGFGATKEAVMDGYWRGVAEELGAVLVAPSGTLTLGAAPENGMSWFPSTSAYTAHPEQYRRTIADAIAAGRERHAIDPGRVWLAGHGPGGYIAIDLAFAEPSTYRAVVALDTTLPEDLDRKLVESAVRAGLRTALVFNRDELAGELDVDALIANTDRDLQGLGLAGSVSGVAAAELERHIVDLLRTFAAETKGG